MAKRIITGFVAAPFVLLLFLAGGIYLKIATSLLILIGMYEVFKAFNAKVLPVHFVAYGFALFYMVFIESFANEGNFFLFSAFFILSILIVLVFFHKIITINDCTSTVFAFFYVAVLMSTMYLVREIADYGIFAVWLIFISAWGSDTGAYFTGITFGKHKLIPSLSPKKTIEGSIGGVLTAALLSAIYGLILISFNNKLPYSFIPLFAIIAACGSVLAQLGDLAASAIKRGTGIKDFGNILPGHGGVIDRFDSVLFTAPSVYILAMLLLEGKI